MATDIKLEDAQVTIIGPLVAGDGLTTKTATVSGAAQAGSVSAQSGDFESLLLGVRAVMVPGMDGKPGHLEPAVRYEVGGELRELKSLTDRVMQIRQGAWWACKNCRVVFSEWSRARTDCAMFPHATGGKGCDKTGSSQYVVHHTVTRQDGQASWMCCFKCKGLFFGGNPTAGACPSGGGHDGTASYDFILFTEGQSVYPGDPGFRWCKVCEQMFLTAPGGGRQGCCAGNPASGHDGSGSASYVLTRLA